MHTNIHPPFFLPLSQLISVQTGRNLSVYCLESKRLTSPWQQGIWLNATNKGFGTHKPKLSFFHPNFMQGLEFDFLRQFLLGRWMVSHSFYHGNPYFLIYFNTVSVTGSMIRHAIPYLGCLNKGQMIWEEIWYIDGIPYKITNISNIATQRYDSFNW